VGQQVEKTMTTSSTNKVRRIFYRKYSGASSEDKFSDPVITVNGVSRAIKFDGNWHYIDVGDLAGVSIKLSAINAHTGSVTLGVDIFAEYYKDSAN
jgi:hypothetical protein